jgi:membrane protein YdbS with pleckstrin-like domain
MTKIYYSKIDIWIIVVLAAAIVLVLFSLIRMLASNTSAASWPIAIVLAVIGIGLPVWLMCATRYTLEPDKLVVRSGPFKWSIPIADITSITPTSNPMSSPALSLDRLCIHYGKGRTIMISPREKAQFVRDIDALRLDKQ